MQRIIFSLLFLILFSSLQAQPLSSKAIDSLVERSMKAVAKPLKVGCRAPLKLRDSFSLSSWYVWATLLILETCLFHEKAEYHFQQDEEVQAYRIIGLAVRLCLEMAASPSEPDEGILR